MDKHTAVILVAVLITVTVLPSLQTFGSDSSDAASLSDLERYDAKVSPFTFPESKGSPVLKALSEADTSVDVSMYYLTSDNAVGILCKLVGNGVTVRVLVDNSPVAVSTDKEFQMLKKLDDLGGDVRLICTKGHTEDRYENVHNKYAVIDGDTVVVTSENWTASNFSSSGNRGWGVVVQSTEYASYMTTVFESDFDDSNADVDHIEDAVTVTAYSGTMSEKVPSYTFTWYDAQVSPVTSPDNSFSAQEALMASAQTRLYAEQLDLSSSYLTTTGSTPIAWMSARADAGVDVRLVLNASYDSEGTGAYKDVEYVNDNTNIRAAAISGGSGFTVTHNKGIVADDKVWVGSVNWTPTSFNSNRECAVVIYSQVVSDYYAGYFETDFNNNYTDLDAVSWKVHYVVDGVDTVVRVTKGAQITLPETPTKESTWLYTYTFSHWEGYTDGMTADGETTFTAVFDQSLNLTVIIGAAVVVLAVLLKVFLGAGRKKKRRSRR